MDTLDLIRILNAAKAARDASDWQGMFTSEIRTLTRVHRQVKIYEPLDEAVAKLQKELDNRTKVRKNRRTNPRTYRAPYKEN